MMCNLNSFKRIAHFEYLPMPGGEKAILEPWRMAVSYLHKYFTDGDEISRSLFVHKSEQLEILIQAIDKHINTPETSSCGRLFDAVASILGVRYEVAYEGQAAIMLESLATRNSKVLSNPGEIELIKKEDKYIISPNKILHKIVELKNKGENIADISFAFHMALIEVFTRIAEEIRSEAGISQVALSGGCFQNILLFKGLMENLRRNDFQVMTNREVPVNDGGISLGQAYWGMHNS
jgi:hydrogenase maturation protein HypF